MTYAELRSQVRLAAAALAAMGIGTGDRVAGYVSNIMEAVVFMLAAASLGAIWSSTSPDFGETAVLDRFKQIEPRIVLSVNAVIYNGRVHDHLGKLAQVVQHLPSVEHVVIVPCVASHPLLGDIANSMSWHDFMAFGDADRPLVYEQLPFDHPLYILFSSGTTGLPKCLVHSAGGTLIQHLKEHMLHGDMTSKDVFFQYTTTGWMMWNWMVSVLAVGATIVLYDGSPFQPSPSALWALVDLLGVTVFGTSAKYLQSLKDAHCTPKADHGLHTLRAIYSTGSPLTPELFDFCYASIKEDMLLGSITGGTDICSLFAGNNAMLPVYRGEIQCRCLGMKVEAWQSSHTPVYGESADLVCTRPFPCQPVYFWNDPDRIKYMSAYFDMYKGVWYHGDFIWINPVTKGVVMLGRSDGTLNPGGVRFGSAELYNIVEQYPQVADSLAVGQIQANQEERVVLFLKLKAGHEFTDSLVKEIKGRVRTVLSPRHVPALILPTPDIPHTVNGKKVEIAVKRILSRQPYTPSGTLVNPDSLEYFKGLQLN